jgi:hypothetical protein
LGYCTYNVRPSDGLTVAAWIGTGTDAGKQVTVTYKKGATNKTAACNDVRNQFCSKFGAGAVNGKGGKCGTTTPACPGRCPTNQKCNASTGYKCVNNVVNKTPTSPSTRPTTSKSPPHVTNPSSSSGGGSNAYCNTNCDAEPIFDNLWCRLRKLDAYCAGTPGGPNPSGNPWNFGGSAFDPQQKDAVCAKNCDTFDVLCKGAKVQAGCSGNDYTLYYIIGGVAVGAVLLIMLLKH